MYVYPFNFPIHTAYMLHYKLTQGCTLPFIHTLWMCIWWVPPRVGARGHAGPRGPTRAHASPRGPTRVAWMFLPTPMLYMQTHVGPRGPTLATPGPTRAHAGLQSPMEYRIVHADTNLRSHIYIILIHFISLFTYSIYCARTTSLYTSEYHTVAYIHSYVFYVWSQPMWLHTVLLNPNHI